jgi:hypothetical protein
MKESFQTRADELPFIPPRQHALPRTTNPHTVRTRRREIPDGNVNEITPYYPGTSPTSTPLMEERVQRRVDETSDVSPPPFAYRIVIPQAPVTGERTVPQIDADEIRYYSYPSTDMVEEYIKRGLLRLNKELNDEDAVQRIVFQLITRARLTTDVFTKLRGMSSKTLSLTYSIRKRPSEFIFKNEVDRRAIPIPQFETNIPKQSYPHSDVPAKALQDTYGVF